MNCSLLFGSSYFSELYIRGNNVISKYKISEIVYKNPVLWILDDSCKCLQHRVWKRTDELRMPLLPVIYGALFSSIIFLTGYRLSNGTFTAAVMRYSNKAGYIEFDDFVLCLVRIKTMFGEFHFCLTS